MLSLKFQIPQKKNTDQSSLPYSAKHRSKEKNGRCRKFSNMAAKLDSRWHVRRLEHVANVVVDALRERKSENRNGFCGMSRQEVRDTARLHIGDTGLIDYVLKSMNNVIVGGYLVRRAVNSCTGVLEYSLQEMTENPTQLNDRVDSVSLRYNSVSSSDVYKDVSYLYQHVLMDSDSEIIEFAVRIVLDSKNFTKEWPFNDDADEFLRFTCRVVPLITTESNPETGLHTRRNSVGEQLVVPLHATIRDLKTAAENAFRDTYCVTEKLEVREIAELDGFDDEEVIFGTIESGSEISARGPGLDLLTDVDLNYEGGADNWVVNCKCGARDDDGERMVACDLCEVWQHTRCSGIGDSEAVPPLFMCYRCCDSIGPQKYPKRVEGFTDWMMVPVVNDTRIDLLY